jgi:hypothetical protein
MLGASRWSRCALIGAFAAVVLAQVGCGAASKNPVEGTEDSGADSGEGVAYAGSVDGATEDAASDAAASTAADAATRNAACTPTSQQTGTVVNTTHGRLDGTLVFVVPPVGDYDQCNGDSSHVHLQVEVSGSVYDIAVDIGTAPNDEVGMYQQAIALPDGAWSEGWHGDDTLSYKTLGLSSTSFPVESPTAIANVVESLLDDTSEISIFCTGYSQGNGCHDVHYEDGTTNDGALVLNPSAASPTIVFFRFSTQTF